MPAELAIKTENLGRVYHIRNTKKGEKTERVALRDVNIEVPRGELFGLLGPNGAGKTTLIKILVTLLAPTSGRAFVAGHNVAEAPHAVRHRINMVSGGESVGYGLLTVRENLWMFGQFYGLDNTTTNRRIKELLEMVGMGDRLNTKTSELSTGLRQKMNIVRGFLTDPQVLFLDEPTLGLDVTASRQVRTFIKQWMGQYTDRTLLLTTHYMVEAEELCDRVAIIDDGRVLACDTPTNLKRRLGRQAIFSVETSPLNGHADDLSSVPGVRNFVHTPHDGKSEAQFILENEDALGQLIATMQQHNIHLLNLQKRDPTLEDVFVDLVGHSLAGN